MFGFIQSLKSTDENCPDISEHLREEIYRNVLLNLVTTR
jgi:hypothetical protein